MKGHPPLLMGLPWQPVKGLPWQPAKGLPQGEAQVQGMCEWGGGGGGWRWRGKKNLIGCLCKGVWLDAESFYCFCIVPARCMVGVATGLGTGVWKSR